MHRTARAGPWFVWLPAWLAVCAPAGAGEKPAEKPPADSSELARYDAKITAEDRSHWAFQPVRRPPVPEVKNSGWCRNPIDRFVLAKLEERDWTPAPVAHPQVLLRRITFDLTGLPPSLQERDDFLADPSPQAVDRLVDRLLARPSYGERWGRHWLDLVRFAESNGYERDAAKPNAWRYRDYVIRAWIDDKPYDRFVTEQLAGDELSDACAETLIATGFNRLGPWDDEPADPQQDRFDQLDDVVVATSEVFLGLTVGCARCHDHKFEPLTMHDYYRMVAVFDPLERPQNGRVELDLPVGRREQLDAQSKRDQRIAELEKQASALRAEFRKAYVTAAHSQLSAEVIAALNTEASKQTLVQKILVKAQAPTFEKELDAAMPFELRQQISALEAEIRWCRETTPDLPRGYFLRERPGAACETHLLLRGQASRPGPRVAPGVPAVLVAGQPDFSAREGSSSGRRLALARWLVSRDNPLFARVIVNRVWQFHFGEGLVRTPSDFGTMGDPPTHPELLDWLADWFVEHGYSLKALHRLILASNTYRMSTAGRAEYTADDPDDRLLWRVPYRRLEVEAIRDAMLAISGRLNPRMYGPSMYPEVPREAIESHTDPGKVWPPFDESEASRRTVYAFIKRSMVVPMIEVLDFCDTARSSPRRNVTSIAPQALTLLNGTFVNRQARHWAGRLLNDVGTEPDRIIDRAYLQALCRPPTASERAAMREFLSTEEQALIHEASAVATGKPLDQAGARRKAVTQMCRVIFNLNEFVYTD